MTGVYPLWMVPTTIAEMPEKGWNHEMFHLNRYMYQEGYSWSGMFIHRNIRNIHWNLNCDIHQGYLWTWASTAGPPSPPGREKIPLWECLRSSLSSMVATRFCLVQYKKLAKKTFPGPVCWHPDVLWGVLPDVLGIWRGLCKGEDWNSTGKCKG